MARSFLVPIDLNQLEIQNVRAQNLASDPVSGVEGQFYYNTVSDEMRYYDGTSWVRLYEETFDQTVHDAHDHSAVANTFTLDEVGDAVANVAFGGNNITGVADPVNPQDAATKAYVDATSQGLDVKGSVRAATSAAGTLASDFEDGDTIDGVTLATGDRILVKDQASADENGIYEVEASGAPTRTDDANTSAEMGPGSFVFVEEGSTNADTGWVMSTDAPFVLDTDDNNWVQFSGAGNITGGDGLTKSGSDLSVNTDSRAIGTRTTEIVSDEVRIDDQWTGQAAITTVGTISSGVWEGTAIAVAQGGTGATDAAGAKTNLLFITSYEETFGNGAAVSFNIDHNLANTDVQVSVYRVSDGADVVADVSRSTSNRVVVATAAAPATNTLRAVVHG